MVCQTAENAIEKALSPKPETGVFKGLFSKIFTPRRTQISMSFNQVAQTSEAPFKGGNLIDDNENFEETKRYSDFSIKKNLNNNFDAYLDQPLHLGTEPEDPIFEGE